MSLAFRAVQRWFARRRKARTWDSRWREGAAPPAWLEDGPRRQVRAARESGWIVAGDTVLDLGCGVGNSAAWLAKQGHEVHGVDVSEVAIERARARYPSVPGVTFECADVATPLAIDRSYDVVLDLGCLHQLGRRGRAGFGANVRRLTTAGSRVLSLSRIWDPRQEDVATVAEHVGSILGPDFRVASAEPTRMEAADAETPRPGVELRFVRKN